MNLSATARRKSIKSNRPTLSRTDRKVRAAALILRLVVRS